MEENKENPNTNSKGAWGIFILMLIPAIIIGGGFYFWNQTSSQLLQSEIDSLKKQNKDYDERNRSLSTEISTLREENDYLKKIQSAPSQSTGSSTVNNNSIPGVNYSNTPPEQNQTATTSAQNPQPEMSKYCLADPETNANGKKIYPINIEKYGGIGYLGELFTADDCGKERLSKISGIKNNLYTIWPDIGLNAIPGPELLSLLKQLGFKTGSNCSALNETVCKHWSLEKDVPLDEILKLKPFAGQILSSGCMNCR